MTRQEAEDFIYASYMRAEPYLPYDMPDSAKRHPEYTKEIIESLYSGTTSIAVTGSKGKGSAAYILSCILSLYGKTGLMTGPHIESFNERFRAGGSMISDMEFAEIVSELAPAFDAIPCDPENGSFISPIGLETAAAEVFFSRHHTDFDIYEHGKGVKYDDVKHIPASYGLINTVFLEHTRELGNTIEEIASDKACIIRAGMKGICCGSQTDEAKDIIIRKAEAERVPLKLFGRDFGVSDIRFMDGGMSCTVHTARKRYDDLEFSLMGSAQCRNLSLAMQAAEDIIGEGFLSSEEETGCFKKKLKELEWFGRLSLLSRDPFILADCCINRESAGFAIEVLKELGIKNASVILVIPDDKDYVGVAEAVTEAGYGIVLSEVPNPHYRFSRERQKKLEEAGIVCGYNSSLTEAIQEKDGALAVLGTTAMLPEIKKFQRRKI